MNAVHTAEITPHTGNGLNRVFAAEEAELCRDFIKYATEADFNRSYSLLHRGLRGYPIGILAKIPDLVPVDFEFPMRSSHLVPTAAVMLCEDSQVWYESEGSREKTTPREFTIGVVTQYNRFPHPISDYRRGEARQDPIGMDDGGSLMYEVPGIAVGGIRERVPAGYKFTPTDISRVLSVESARIEGPNEEQAAIDELDSISARPITSQQLDEKIRRGY